MRGPRRLAAGAKPAGAPAFRSRGMGVALRCDAVLASAPRCGSSPRFDRDAALLYAVGLLLPPTLHR